jgi:putative Holliday junction resolvase
MMGPVFRRILAVDPGAKRIGIAVSDPTGTIASPLTVIKHTSRREDAARVAELAAQQGAVRIIVGHPLDADGEVGPAAARAARFAEVLREITGLPVDLWDEFGSTREARQARIALGVSRAKRRGHLDHLAAAVILQSYLDFIASHPLTSGEEGA